MRGTLRGSGPMISTGAMESRGWFVACGVGANVDACVSVVVGVGAGACIGVHA